MELTKIGLKGEPIASASTITPEGTHDSFDVTGTTTISTIETDGRGIGARLWLRFNSAVTLTHHASNLILADGSSRTTAPGDVLLFEVAGEDQVRELRLAGADITERVQDIVGAFFVAGTGMTLTYDDSANTFTVINSAPLTTEQVQDIVGAMATSGTGATATYDDTAGTLTISATGDGTGLTTEQVQDIVGTLLVQGTNITLSYDDGAGSLTITAAGGSGGGGSYATADVPDPASRVGSTIWVTDGAAGSACGAISDGVNWLRFIPGVAIDADFAYADISGLYFLYNAASLSLGNGDPVGTWPDSSGNARDAVSSGSGDPIFEVAGINGRPCVKFDAPTLRRFSLPNLSSLTSGEIFLVAMLHEDPAAYGGGLWRMGTDGVDTHYPYSNGTIYDEFGTSARKTTVNPAADMAAPHIYNVSSATGAWTSRMNGTELYTTGTNTVAFPSSPTFGDGPGAGGRLNGRIAFIGLWDRVLNSTERGAITAALTARYLE